MQTCCPHILLVQGRTQTSPVLLLLLLVAAACPLVVGVVEVVAQHGGQHQVGPLEVGVAAEVGVGVLGGPCSLLLLLLLLLVLLLVLLLRMV